MGTDKQYLIGEFSEMTGTSIRTLHYYDEIGLLQPEKHPSSGHRLYTDRDLLKMQKIVSLKFLGYSLDQICEMMNESSFDVSLIETLKIQKSLLEEKKEHIESALAAIKRTITLLEDEGEVDSAILMSLINNVQTEKNQRRWLEKHMPQDVVNRLYNKTEEDKVILDKEFIQLSKEVKRLAGKPVDDPEVQDLIEKHMKATVEYIGEDAMQAFAGIETADAEELEKMVMIPSPYTKEEEDWLNQAMEYYMIQNNLYDPNAEQK
ncbi:MerR family transcriptional regulator [Bacillus canaveralius]|uniref:MerR family transcriptional regulator n=1 Tax=Bacillus canaveralius TaxID=1403243 RepID=A0A2N5GSC6_9BACI|nr:MerR family transcriptional regulator [Bacillus canaveralius]PLR86556.1 MerR family transcriptional regulator [Bacillus canaveralius]PLS00327.1 MerR family transcriptional regulator [Bacillus canaveralius]